MKTLPEWTNRDLNESIEKCIIYNNSNMTCECEASGYQKLLNYINRYTDEKNIDFPYYPETFQWCITNKCNLRCKHCYVDDYIGFSGGENDLSTKECLNLIDQLKEMNVLRIDFSGGEIFSRNDFLIILEYVKNKNIAVSLLTNGLLLTDDIISKMDEILHPKIDFVQISLDGATKETHEKIRGKNTFDKTIENIKKLIKTKIYFRVNFTPTNVNVIELPDAYKLCNDLQVKEFSFAMLREIQRNDYLSPDHSILLKATAEIIDMSKSLKTFIANSIYKDIVNIVNNVHTVKYAEEFKSNTINFASCTKDIKYLSMSSEGKVSLCQMGCYSDIFIIGNVKEEPIIDIWNRRFDSLIFKGRETCNLVCKNCQYLDKCEGGCVAMAYFHTGNINAPDPDCKIWKTN